jgi:hypothetical protein
MAHPPSGIKKKKKKTFNAKRLRKTITAIRDDLLIQLWPLYIGRSSLQPKGKRDAAVAGALIMAVCDNSGKWESTVRSSCLAAIFSAHHCRISDPR